MKSLSLLLILFFLVACSPKNIITLIRGPEKQDKISAVELEQRYRALWDSVEQDKPLPKLVVHIGASSAKQTALWVLTEDRILKSSERIWSLDCGADQSLQISESIYDPIFRVAYLVVSREGTAGKVQPCVLGLGSTRAKLTLPKQGLSGADNQHFSFLAFSCNQPFSTKIRGEQTGVLVRDLSLWLRMQTRARGENSEGQLPFAPKFVLGLGDQVYVDPDPAEEKGLAFFGGRKSNQWLIDTDKQSLWYYRYQPGNFYAKAHLKAMPEDVTPAGLIIPLRFPELPNQNKLTEKQNILSGIQKQSIFCTVNETNFEETLAKSWTLEGLASCVPLKTPFKWPF